MVTMNVARRVALLTLAAMLATLVGCAQEVGDIDRTQANALLKSDFMDSEWYIRTTVSEIPPASYASFVGMTWAMERVRWEITEDYLIAYRAYERTPGTRSDAEVDGNGDYEFEEWERDGYGGEYYEAPIAAYPINDHFDVQRSYNAATGEQSNVLDENTSDREWDEREWFRVDWQTQIASFDMGPRIGGWDSDEDGMISADISWYVQETEDGVDASRFEYFNSSNITEPGIAPADYNDGQLYYFDFVNRLVMARAYAQCYGGFLPMGPDECASEELEVRTSILRVPNNSEYEPVDFDDIDMQKFGYFRTERVFYDRRLGTRISSRVELANRHNIWSNTWQRDAAGEILRDDEGRRLTNPFSDRIAEPVVYHTNLGYPENLWDETVQLADGWNRALRRAVAAAQNVDIESVREMYIICHSPVSADDDAACGAEGTIALVGDLRYNFIYWVDQLQSAGPLGYGPSSADPETGEVIAAQAFVYGAAVDTYAEFALEFIQFLNGDLDIEGISDADFIRDAIRSRADPNVDPRASISPELSVRLDSINLMDQVPQAGQDFFAQVERDGWRDFEFRPGEVQRRQEFLAETGLELTGINGEMARGLALMSDQPLDGLAPNSMSTLPDDVQDMLSAEGLSSFHRTLEDRREFEDWAQQNNIMLPTALDDTIVGLAQSFAGRTDYDNVYQELRGIIYRAVQEHEVGHTLGLRHNFQGSYDSLNYGQTFWELKTAGVLGLNDGSGNVEVVAFDEPTYVADIYGMAQMTDAQVTGRMREYQYSSIMDYSSQFNTDIHGIGLYDEAAIIYGYTAGRDTTSRDFQPDHPLYNTQQRGYVEVFDDVGTARDIFESFEGLDSPGYTDMLEVYHYSTIVTEMANDGSGFDPGDAGSALIRARLSSRHLERFDNLVNMREAEVPDRPIEVPYLFLSDFWAGARQSARRYDQGADPLEQALNMIERYRTHYPFEYFRRDRLDWSPFDVLNRFYGRYGLPLVDNYQRWIFSVGNSDTIIAAGWQYGAFASLNLLAEVMTTPSYGSYQINNEMGQYELTSYGERSDADLYIEQGVGRRPFSSFDASLGYHYWYNQEPEAGHFWAFYAAALLLSQSSSIEVRGAEVASDFLTYSLPVYLIFEEEMTTLFNGMWLENNAGVSPVVVNEQGEDTIYQRRMITMEFNAGEEVDPETGFASVAAMSFNGDDINGTPIELFTGFSNRWYPIVWGMLFFSQNYSLNYVDQARLYRLGTGETLTPPVGYETIVFCDELAMSGVCWGAIQRENETEPGLGASMIIEAQRLMDDYLDTVPNNADINDGDATLRNRVTNHIENINIVEGLAEILGSVF